jgi:hypothetical protein
MKLYQTTDGTFCGTQDEFFTLQVSQTGGPKSQYNPETVDVPVDKAGLIEFLNHLAAGNDAHDTIVEDDNETEPRPVAQPAATPVWDGNAGRALPDSCEQALAANQWPIAFQMQLAALIMENARTELGK